MPDLTSTLAERVDAFTPTRRPAFGALVKRRRRQRTVRAGAAITAAVAAAGIGVAVALELPRGQSVTTSSAPSTTPSPAQSATVVPVTAQALAGTWLRVGAASDASHASGRAPGTLVITAAAINPGYQGTMSYWDGCNTRQGDYRVSPSGALSVGRWGITRRLCLGGSTSRMRFGVPRQVELEGDQLTLSYDEEKRTAFRRVVADARSQVLQNPTAGRTGPLPGDEAIACAEGYAHVVVARRAFAFDGVVVKVGPSVSDRGDEADPTPEGSTRTRPTAPCAADTRSA